MGGVAKSSELSREQLESKYRLYRRLTAILAVVSVFLGLTLVGQLTLQPAATETSQENTETAEEAPEESSVVRRDPNDKMAIGDVAAPVVLVQFTDLRCPFCAAFHRDTFPTLLKDYVDSGKVRIELNDVAFFGSESEDAAVAARAAARQDKFFEYLDAVYEAAPEKGHPDMPQDKLIEFAKAAGVPDIEQFSADLDDPDLRQAAQNSTSVAQSLGVNSVPFFVAGTTAISGAQPLNVFQDFIDQAVRDAS